MTAKSSFYFEDDKLWIAMEAWTDLIGEQSAVPLYSLKSAAAASIEHGGAFIIKEDKVGIKRRCDRMSELGELMREVDDFRRKHGLQAL